MTPPIILSACFPTDTVEALRSVLERLRAQTIASSIELVVATPDAPAARTALQNESTLGAVRIVEVPSLTPLGHARAAAIRAATAPYVFLGETHSFGDPKWAATVVARHEEGWAVVVPGLANANPRSLLSWSGFLLDYGAWLENRPSGEIQYWPLNNSSCRRSALLECGDSLERSLSFGDELLLSLRARGHRVYFEPRAVLAHLNMTRLAPWIHERWLGGLLVARYRSTGWSAAKRLFYALASPLIPMVLFSRVAGSALETVRAKQLPLTTLPVMFLGSVVHGLGELVGYSRLGAIDRAEVQMAEYEIHKMRYAPRVS